ncbi:MAG: hypothetical protein RSC43_00975 [Clostridia bacterium]
MSWVSRLQVLQLLQTVPIKYGKVYRVYFSRDNVYLALVLTRLLSYTHLEDNPLDCIRQLTAVLQFDYRPQKETFLIDSNRALMTILEKNSISGNDWEHIANDSHITPFLDKLHLMFSTDQLHQTIKHYRECGKDESTIY